jgi:hypothetical protein
MTFPTPHLDKLKATLENEKLPACDRDCVTKAIGTYKGWVAKLDAVKGKPEEILQQSVDLLNQYRLFIDIDLIFDSKDNFLYRQKGQLKLDNSVIEEFLPRLIQPSVIPELKDMEVSSGPKSSFASLFFTSSLATPQVGGGLNVREKDQDFSICKPLYIWTSHSPNFREGQFERAVTNITYVAAECKTNLDKTMFQEACATARDTKFAVNGASYYLLAEWLDMSPLSTAATEIDEVILLRKAKRINSNVRSAFATVAGRQKARADYVNHLKKYPLRTEMFGRFVAHVAKILRNEAPEEREVLDHGYF